MLSAPSPSRLRSSLSYPIGFWFVGPQPLDDFNAIAVGIVDKEALGAGNRRSLLNAYAMVFEVISGAGDIGDSYREVAWTNGVRFVFEQ